VLLAISGCNDHSAGRSHRVGRRGITLELPAGWHQTGRRDDIVDPVMRVAVSSSAFPVLPGPCQVGTYQPKEDAVSIVVFEWTKNTDPKIPPRPRRFTRSVLPIAERSIDCFDGSGGSTEFYSRDRLLGTYVLLGRRAPRHLADEALEVLDTLRVNALHYP
jgi:hypothetical protein